MGDSQELSSARLQTVGKIAALVLFVLILCARPPSDPELPKLSAAAQRLAAVTALMAMLWLTQAIPIAATSLIPLVAFPLLAIQSAKEVSKSYINESIFLFLGGFIIAMGIEKWGLHRRIALHTVRVVGTSLRLIVLGFMAATAFLSMWISNTASTLLMLPIGLAMIHSLEEFSNTGSDAPETSPADRASSSADLARMSVVLMLAIAYSASIGGLTTLVGTPTNVTFKGIWEEEFPDAPGFSTGSWMAATLPFGIVFLLSTWGVLTFRLKAIPGTEHLNRRFFTQRLGELGKPSRPERMMLAVFAVTAFLWIVRKPLQNGIDLNIPGWKDWKDSTVAIAMALLMFILPARRNTRGRTEYLMDWRTAEKLPWGVLLLIGGGFALAGAFKSSGLSEWIGGWFAIRCEGMPAWMLVAAVCLLLTFLTEMTTNVATVSVFLPILAAVAVNKHIAVDPRLIMIPATIATSCAFMLPIATPPNAIVFGSGKIRMGQMMRYGLVLNLLGVVLLTAATFLILVPLLGISLDGLPEWAHDG